MIKLNYQSENAVNVRAMFKAEEQKKAIEEKK
jgi:hypothetical protein